MTVITSTHSPNQRIDAVVLGGSAGGVEALLTLLPALPADLPVAIFIVLHLPRVGPSLLVDIFGRKCALPVREAQDKEDVEPGVVYVAPPDYHLLIDRGPALALSADEPLNYSRPSVDVLFESAADVYGDRLLGVILSGGNDDGSAGLRAVHEAGGLSAVQRPDEAKVSAMPESALRLTPSAQVLSAEAIAKLIEMSVNRSVA